MEWLMEQDLLYIYLFLAHRLHGFSLSDFWEQDSFATSYLYCQCYNLAKKEEEAMNGGLKAPPEEQAYDVTEEEMDFEDTFLIT